MKEKIEVVIAKTYEIELDNDYFTEEWMESFRECYYELYTLEDHMEHIAQYVARFGYDYIEGYGHPLWNGVAYADERTLNKAINIVTLDASVETYID